MDTVTVAPVPRLPEAGLRQRVLDWLKQPSTLQGLALMAAGIALAAIHPFASAEGIGAVLIAGGIPLLAPDNTSDAIRTRDMANAIAHAAAVRSGASLELVVDKAVTDLARP